MFDLILLLFAISSIVFIILLGAAVFHKEKVVNICICILTWMTLFFLFPYVARKYNVIKEKWVAILIMFASPALFATGYIVATEVIGISPYRYTELKFTSKNDIISLTGITDFPDYEYLNNSYDSWSGTHTIRFLFKEEPPKTFYEKIESLIKDKDNVYWSSDNSLEHASDKKFFGSDHIYIYSHGWDGKYISAPNENMPENVTLHFFIGKRGFVCRYNEYSNVSLTIFGDRDSISARTGVQFPAYKNVNCDYMDIGPDWAEDWTILFDEKPSKEFIRQIKASPDWTPLENKPGCYEYSKTIEYKSIESIIVDESSRVVKANYGTL